MAPDEEQNDGPEAEIESESSRHGYDLVALERALINVGKRLRHPRGALLQTSGEAVD